MSELIEIICGRNPEVGIAADSREIGFVAFGTGGDRDVAAGGVLGA